MSVKVGNKYMGTSPEEQIKLERKRFKARLRRLEQAGERKRVKLLKTDDGKNRKLI